MRSEHDPIDQVRKRILDGNIADENKLKEIDKEVKDLVTAAADFAQESPEPDPKDLFRDVCDVAVTDGFSGGLVVAALAEAAPAPHLGIPGVVVGVAGTVVVATSTTTVGSTKNPRSHAPSVARRPPVAIRSPSRRAPSMYPSTLSS